MKSSMKKILSVPAARILTLLALFAATTALNAAPMTNADVIKMAKAGIDESVIITSIQNAESGFDASADGLIALAGAQVPKPVINAVIARASAAKTAAPAATATTPSATTGNANLQGEDEIIMNDKGVSTTLKYVKPERRAAARGGFIGAGFAGNATYCVLPKPTASLRATPNATFVVSVPENAGVESHVVLALFETRKNGTREILIAGGSNFTASRSTGIPQERSIALKIEKAADQSRAPAQHIIYTLTPEKPLKKGEYAFMADDKCFDFGVD